MSKNFKPLSVVTLGALVGSLALGSAANAASMFTVQSLGSAGYMAVGEGKCGEGKCGEGKCGMDKMDTNKDGMVSKAEHAAGSEMMFEAADANKDGNVSKDEMDKAMEGKCGADKAHEGKCGADKAKEGSCGADKAKEGKCGGAA